jgi:predicted dehydrogenase
MVPRSSGQADVNTKRLAIVGLGKIAQDRHILAIAADGDIELVAIAADLSPQFAPSICCNVRGGE